MWPQALLPHAVRAEGFTLALMKFENKKVDSHTRSLTKDKGAGVSHPEVELLHCEQTNLQHVFCTDGPPGPP